MGRLRGHVAEQDEQQTDRWKRAGHWASYAPFRVVEFCLRLLPLPLVFHFGGFVGFCAYIVTPKYRRLALRNLCIAFGKEKEPRELRALARRSFSRLGANFACSLVLPRLNEEQVLRRVEVVRENGTDEPGARGKGLLCCIPHMGAWEILSLSPRLFADGLIPSTMYQTLGNPLFDAYVRRRRSTIGLTLYDRKSGFRGPLKHLKAGGAVGILTDQHAGDHGTWTPLFGRLASTTPLPAILAERTGAVLQPINVETIGTARWRIVCGTPIEHAETPEKTAARMNVHLGETIRNSPEDWFWVHNRWKTPTPKFLLTTYKRGIVLPETTTAADLQAFEILVRSPNWLGDICMAIPAVRAMKVGRPDARITILSPGKFASIWRLVAEIDKVIEKGDKDSPFKVGKLVRATGIQYEVAVLLPNSLRSALEAKAAKVGRTVGFLGHSRAKLMDQIVPEPDPKLPPEHQTRRLLRLAAEIGANPGTLEGAVHMVSEHQPDPNQIRVAVCPGAAYGDAKRLPTDKFAETINIATLRIPNVEWVIVGTEAEAGIAADLQNQIQANVRNLAGQTNLDQLIETLSGSHALLSNDTGTMHLGAALGVPTIAIFGSTEPALTGPLGKRHIVIRNHVECSPCFLRECPIDFRCMASVDPKVLALSVIDMIQREADHPWGS